jgi:hypothetical protein
VSISAAEPTHRGSRLLAAIDLARAQHQVGAGLRERLGHLAAKAAAAAGDDRDLAGEVEQILDAHAWIIPCG